MISLFCSLLHLLHETLFELLLDQILLSFHLYSVGEVKHGWQAFWEIVISSEVNHICNLTKILGILVDFVKCTSTHARIPSMRLIDSDDAFHMLAAI